MVSFIDAHRDAHGVEPICRVLPIAPSTYYSHVAGRSDPERLSDRARRNAALRSEIRRVFEENWRVYGVRKVWRQLGREGFDVALHGRLADEGHGHPGHHPRQAAQDDDPRQEAPMPAGQGEPAIQGTRTQQAVGAGFPLCRHLERIRLCSFRHRRLCPQDRGLARQHLRAGGVRARRLGTGRAPPRPWARFTTATVGPNICPFAIQSDWRKPASNHQSAASETATTTPWRKRSTGCSRPRSSTVAAHGAVSRPCNTPLWNGSIGSTTDACSSQSETSHPQKPRPTATQLWKLKPWPRNY